jgi:AcrR family transcriptional regulator
LASSTRSRGDNTEPAGDGRVQRGARNREAIVEALFQLVEAGDLVPTAERVAARAGVGTRTVFRHFEDMDRLFAEVHALLEREVQPLLASRVPDGGLEQRITALVRRRAQLFERISPFKRSSQTQRWRSPFLQQGHNEMVRRLRTDLIKAIPELTDASEALRDGMELVTSFEAWDRLRCEQRLGRERAEAVVQAAVLALLASPKAGG